MKNRYLIMTTTHSHNDDVTVHITRPKERNLILTSVSRESPQHEALISLQEYVGKLEREVIAQTSKVDSLLKQVGVMHTENRAYHEALEVIKITKSVQSANAVASEALFNEN